MPTATPRSYFDEALRVLAREGRNGLRIGRLCAALGVTSGSSYHHFGGWDGFVVRCWSTRSARRSGASSRPRSAPSIAGVADADLSSLLDEFELLVRAHASGAWDPTVSAKAPWHAAAHEEW